MRLQSGIVAYEYGLSSLPTGDEDGQPDITPFVYIGLVDQAAVIDVELLHAHTYYGGVRALVCSAGSCCAEPRVTDSRGLFAERRRPEVQDLVTGRQEYMREEFKSHLENFQLSL